MIDRHSAESHKKQKIRALAGDWRRFQVGLVWVKAVLTHKDYDKGEWK